jgi:hypothetical protein
MPTYADLSGWVISIIAGRFELIADTKERKGPKTPGKPLIATAAFGTSSFRRLSAQFFGDVSETG